MRDLKAILCDHGEANRRSIEAADALFVKLEEVSRADAALLECWPSFEDYSGECSSIAKFVYTCGALRHPADLSHDPTSAGLGAELEEAFRFAEPDAVFTIELAALWLKNGWPAQELRAFFMGAGIDLDTVSAGLLVDTSEWLRARETITQLRTDLML